MSALWDLTDHDHGWTHKSCFLDRPVFPHGRQSGCHSIAATMLPPPNAAAQHRSVRPCPSMPRAASRTCRQGLGCGQIWGPFLAYSSVPAAAQLPDVIGAVSQAGGWPRWLSGRRGPRRVSGSGPPLSPPTLNGSAGADGGPRRLGPLSSCGGWGCPAGSAVCCRCWGRKCSGPCLFLDISLLISVSRSSPANSATPGTHDGNYSGLHERRRARLGRWIRNPSVLPWGRGLRNGWHPVPNRFGFSSTPDNEAGWRVPDKTKPHSLPQLIM